MSAVPRLAVLTDFPEEGWPSMDLCADMLLANLAPEGAFAIQASRICPPFRRVATGLPAVASRNASFNVDRLLNRFLFYPRFAHQAAKSFDLYHVVDHTYAQMLHALPAGRTGVYCHDLDAFRCVLDPRADRRPRWFRAMATRILNGFQKAAVVFHNTAAVGHQLVEVGIAPPERLVLAPLGVAPEFVPDPPGSSIPRRPLAELDGKRWILHVGSCIPRKRIDVLLDVVSGVREAIPDIRLVKAGGQWSELHRDQIARLGLERSIVHLTGLSRTELAELYRRASIIIVPSEAEGFGLPVIEALACGAQVVASDIPALREAGGQAAAYAPVADVPAWTDLLVKLLTSPEEPSARAARLAQAAKFTWRNHAETIAEAYHRLV